MLIRDLATMGEDLVFPGAASGTSSCSNCKDKTSPTTRGRTPTQRSHIAEVEAEAYDYHHHHKSSHNYNYHENEHDSDRRLPTMVYVVTDTCYPSAVNFDTNLGTTSVISVHGSKAAANERAKKIIYENDGGCTVDIDKIIEEVKMGLYTGIGVGGKEEKEGCCFARKCEVEAKMIDEDSEDEGSGGSVGYGGSDQDNRGRETNRRREGGDEWDVDMG
ncbi:hypothetical protein T440DRAFT_4100 [Plenodomus tracheiphilus IPT5]|uniref:Uncharacterized protein n=1 Tax=Plenodomus tracheiphilus IPT5 TaxID=1408161 RepID=A0A6A7BME9_9PLEO|nr:hypothetical protein T440DRAFT_4100 [Plenodomus tracheiphilus IPT5]